MAHDHAADDGNVHVHIHSVWLYVGVFAALIALTVITVLASYVDIDGFILSGADVGVGAWNLVVAMLIATMKATLVVLWFMHLKDDRRFNALFFVGALLFVAVFFAYTMNDTNYRGSTDRYDGNHVNPDTGERAEGGLFQALHGQRAAEGLPEAEEEGGGHDGEAAGEHGAAHGEEGAGEEGAAEDGAAEEGAAEDGAAEEAAAEDGTAEEGSAEEGADEAGDAPEDALEDAPEE